MTGLPSFESAPTWEAAGTMLTFLPIEPKHTAGFGLQGLRIFVRDHRLREVPMGDRTLEAHYGGFVFSQSRHGVDEARRLALVVSYGRAPRDAQIAGRLARIYELGAEPPPDDVDGRSPAVLTWFDGEMFYLIASTELVAEALLPIAASLYA
jgi:hypothetical protein